MKRWIIIGSSILVIIVAVVLLAYNSNKQQAAQQNNAQEKNVTTSDKSAVRDESTVNTDTQPADQQPVNGAYTSYSEEAFANANGTRVLFFHAPWCPQCRAIDKGFQNNPTPAGFTVLKTDYDSNQALREKYGVTLQTTFVVVDDNGQLVKKYVAYDDPSYESVKTNLLDTL